MTTRGTAVRDLSLPCITCVFVSVKDLNFGVFCAKCMGFLDIARETNGGSIPYNIDR